jgi:acyl-coenzyme A thioesterase PaaI-like protein
MTLNSILDKAKNSSFYLYLLNIVLRRIIPYNAPHRFKVEKVNEESLEVSIPFIKKNKNHINGIHACALATLCEYISGLSLARALPPENYRLILQTIHVDYHYQGKTKLFARFGIDDQQLNEIKSALKRK